MRYRLLGGENITWCPVNHDYANGEIMVLRFLPLAEDVTGFHLVEGEGGQDQLIDPASSNRRYWNFLHVQLEGLIRLQAATGR